MNQHRSARPTRRDPPCKIVSAGARLPSSGGVALIALGLLAGACGSGSKPAPQPGEEPRPAAATPGASSPASDLPAEAVAQATEIFNTRCTPCHGPGGKGDGPASKGLTPPPRNFTLPEWQASVTDEHVEKIIAYGGAAVGKSLAMPPNPDLVAKPEVIKALRAHVRGLAAH